MYSYTYVNVCTHVYTCIHAVMEHGSGCKGRCDPVDQCLCCVCTCVCVCRDREREIVCVCVCVRRERASARERERVY